MDFLFFNTRSYARETIIITIILLLKSFNVQNIKSVFTIQNISQSEIYREKQKN